MRLKSPILVQNLTKSCPNDTGVIDLWVKCRLKRERAPLCCPLVAAVVVGLPHDDNINRCRRRIPALMCFITPFNVSTDPG